MKSPKQFSWKVTTVARDEPKKKGNFQSQCRSGGGGNGRCGGKCKQ